MTIKQEFIRTVFLNTESHRMIMKYIFDKCQYFYLPNGQLQDERYLEEDLKAFKSVDSVLDFLVDIYSSFTVKELIEWEFTNLSETEINTAYLKYIKSKGIRIICFSGYCRLLKYLVESVAISGICKRVESELKDVKTKKQINEIKGWVYDEGM